jgi:hypothetical protein
MKDFVPYNISLQLKEFEFDEPCFGRFYTKPRCKMFSIDEKGRHYPIKNTSKKLYTTGEHFVLKDENIIIAPTYSQAFRWFREKYHIIGEVKFKGGLTTKTAWYNYVIYSQIDWEDDNPNEQWKTYEEAELACLKKLIEIVKNRK